MKQHLKRYGIYYLVGFVILVGVVVCIAAYRPAVGTDISNQNADWGNFGAFFWGFGTMCFTLLNVIVFYIISQRIYRRDFYNAYRDALNRLIEAFLSTQNNNNVGGDIFNEKIKTSMISMIGILGAITESNAYDKAVTGYAKQLHDKCNELIKQATENDFIDYISNLSGFQVCLLNNEVSNTRYQ